MNPLVQKSNIHILYKEWKAENDLKRQYCVESISSELHLDKQCVEERSVSMKETTTALKEP